jgi:1-acyl-sn-glycerol-3-phosphate acyltransferase
MRKILSACYLVYAALIFVSLMLIVFPFVLISSAIFKANTGKKIILILLRCWAWCFSMLTCFWVKTLHQNRINKNVPHIYVGNHGSYLDAIAVCLSIPQHFSPLGKLEMTKIPIFGLIYKRIVILIDRSSKESRAESVAILRKELENGQSILIFPEGTMNKTEQALTTFYDGAFRIAIETQTPIQPFVMLNNRTLLPRTNPLLAKPGMIKTVLLPSIPVTGLRLDELEQLKLKVFTTMEQAILKHQ